MWTEFQLGELGRVYLSFNHSHGCGTVLKWTTVDLPTPIDDSSIQLPKTKAPQMVSDAIASVIPVPHSRQDPIADGCGKVIHRLTGGHTDHPILPVAFQVIEHTKCHLFAALAHNTAFLLGLGLSWERR